MTAALSPDLALAYVRELSTDVAAGVVLSRTGRILAGDGRLVEPARALVAVAEDRDFAVRTARGVVVGARSEDGVALVVVCTPHAIEGVTALDVRAALEALDATRAAEVEHATVSEDFALQRELPPPDRDTVRKAAEAVISATHLAM